MQEETARSAVRRQRSGSAALLALVLGSCTSGIAPRPTPATPAYDERALRQCLGDLTRQQVAFRTLSDRRFENGCSAVGTLQLLDIGTPVTNLGPMTCTLARSFANWTRAVVQPAARRWLGMSVRRIESFGTYSCRPRNSQPGARLSEHGRSNAVDIAAFQLADGRRIAVLDGWNGVDENVRRFLREVHREGCRRFAVGLGPDANAAHRDHLHFDMGADPYCR